jgi:hypothetical protein
VKTGQLMLASAEDDLQSLLNPGPKMGPSIGQSGLFWGAILFVVLVLVGWALFIRKRDQRIPGFQYGRRVRHGSSAGAESNSTMSAGEPAQSRRRRRRRHRARNPTLSECGGLPPVREDQPPEPSA